jgi:hypothetical protein
MSLRSWSQKEVLNPRGAWTADALTHKGTPSRASLAQNVRFFPGKVYSREGTSNVLAVGNSVAGMFDWITPTDHLLCYMSGSAFSRYRFADATTITLLGSLPGSTYAPSFADLGPRNYFTAYDNTGAGTIQAHIYDGVTAIDSAFRPPLVFTAGSASDGGVGGCTQGTHYIGFIFQSRSGFSGKPSPVNISSIFVPLSVTLNAGLRQINVSITLDTPADAGIGSAMYPIITRADNPNEYYFVPDNFAILPPSTAGWTQSFNINVSDEDLAASAEPATNQFSLLTQSAGGAGPFNPQVVAAYGLRMCYLVGNQLYVSEVNDPQRIAADLNTIQLLNQRKMATVAPLDQSLILYGEKWTAAVSDNGDEPVTWPPPRTISDSIGAPFPGCIESHTAGSYHWVAAEAGLYVFDGAYPSRPITYLQSDNWKRINWAAAYSIQIADDIINLKCYVAVPLDGATVPNYMFCIDYTNGMTFDTCDISLDQYFGGGTFRSIRMVKELTSNRTALWIGPAAAGNIVHADPTVVNDSGTAIHPIWESGYVRDGNDMIRTKTVRVGGADLWVRGTGTLIFTVFGLDRTTQSGPDTMALSTAPGQELYDKFDISQIENYTFRFETNGVNDSFQLSGFRSYTKPSLSNR